MLVCIALAAAAQSKVETFGAELHEADAPAAGVRSAQDDAEYRAVQLEAPGWASALEAVDEAALGQALGARPPFTSAKGHQGLVLPTSPGEDHSATMCEKTAGRVCLLPQDKPDDLVIKVPLGHDAIASEWIKIATWTPIKGDKLCNRNRMDVFHTTSHTCFELQEMDLAVPEVVENLISLEASKAVVAKQLQTDLTAAKDGLTALLTSAGVDVDPLRTTTQLVEAAKTTTAALRKITEAGETAESALAAVTEYKKITGAEQTAESALAAVTEYKKITDAEQTAESALAAVTEYKKITDAGFTAESALADVTKYKKIFMSLKEIFEATD